MDWFLYDNGLRHERVNYCLSTRITSNIDLNYTVKEKINFQKQLPKYVPQNSSSGNVSKIDRETPVRELLEKQSCMFTVYDFIVKVEICRLLTF